MWYYWKESNVQRISCIKITHLYWENFNFSSKTVNNRVKKMLCNSEEESKFTETLGVKTLSICDGFAADRNRGF